MATLDCRLIQSSSPLRSLILDPIQEGIYALFHASVIEGGWTNPQALKERVSYGVLGVALIFPIIGAIALQILVRISMSYQDGLRDAVQNNDVQTVEKYLKIGVSPNNIYDTQPLLFQTTNPEILQALIEHGADTMRRYREQSFLEYLVENSLEDSAEKYFDPSYLDEEIYRSAIAKTDSRFAVFLIRMGTPHIDGRSHLSFPNAAPLEEILIKADGEDLRIFAEAYPASTMHQAFLAVKMKWPRLYTGWIWNAFYTIPESHFAQAASLQKKEALPEGPPPTQWQLEQMFDLFKTINFNDPTQSGYIPPSELKNTLENETQYKPADIKTGLRNIAQAVQTGFQVYHLTEDERVNYTRQVEWILYYLSEGATKPLQRVRASILIEMGKTCLMCPGRYNDLFDNALRRLKGDDAKVLSIEDQLIIRFADLRGRLINRVVYNEAKRCTHSRDNLVFHLHAFRGIVGTKPQRIFTSQGVLDTQDEHYKFIFRSDAIEAFDKEYTPFEMAEAILECVREGKKKTQDENDFNELLFDAMIDAYAQIFPEFLDLEEMMKERIDYKTLFEDQILPVCKVKALFQPIDPEWEAREEGLTVAQHFSQFKKDFLGPKVRPLNEDLLGYAFPEVIHPLILGKYLCDLGHLKSKISSAKETFQMQNGITSTYDACRV